MKTEFEAKFLNINKAQFRNLLKEHNATLVSPERKMRRVTFDIPNLELPEDEFKWLRVRDEGESVTMNLKHLKEKGRIDDVKELEFEIGHFENAVAFLEEIGMIRKGYQESIREEWKVEEVEVSIDTWPGLKPFTEIEGHSEKDVKRIAEVLGFDYSDALFGSVDYVYERELNADPYIINAIPEITFENFEEILPKILKKQ